MGRAGEEAGGLPPLQPLLLAPGGPGTQRSLQPVVVLDEHDELAAAEPVPQHLPAGFAEPVGPDQRAPAGLVGPDQRRGTNLRRRRLLEQSMKCAAAARMHLVVVRLLLVGSQGLDDLDNTLSISCTKVNWL